MATKKELEELVKKLTKEVNRLRAKENLAPINPLKSVSKALKTPTLFDDSLKLTKSKITKPTLKTNEQVLDVRNSRSKLRRKALFDQDLKRIKNQRQLNKVFRKLNQTDKLNRQQLKAIREVLTLKFGKNKGYKIVVSKLSKANKQALLKISSKDKNRQIALTRQIELKNNDVKNPKLVFSAKKTLKRKQRLTLGGNKVYTSEGELYIQKALKKKGLTEAKLQEIKAYGRARDEQLRNISIALNAWYRNNDIERAIQSLNAIGEYGAAQWLTDLKNNDLHHVKLSYLSKNDSKLIQALTPYAESEEMMVEDVFEIIKNHRKSRGLSRIINNTIKNFYIDPKKKG